MSQYPMGVTRAAGFVLAVLTASLVTDDARGQTTNYLPNVFGNWTDPDSWDNGVPDAVGANAVFNQPHNPNALANTINQTFVVSLNNTEVTLGSLTSNNDTTASPNTVFVRTEFQSGSFVFETASGPATLNENLGASTELENRMRINVPVKLNSSLVVNSNHALNRNTNTEFVQLVQGDQNKTITKEGFGNLQFAHQNTLAEGEGFFGKLIINNGGVRVINANTGNPPPNTQFSKSAGITVLNDGVKGGQFQLGNRITSFTLGVDPANGNAPAEIKLNGPGKLAPATTAQNDGALRFEITTGFNTTFDSPVNLQTASHIHVNQLATTASLTKEVRGGGELQKTGSGTLALTSANIYTGGTSVLAGTVKVDGSTANLGTGNVSVANAAGTSLRIETGVTNAIANSATLTLGGGGTALTADQGFAFLGAGINETIGGLVLGATPMAAGTTYSGATGSGAANIFDEYFSGGGMVTVAASFLAADFNNSGNVNSTDLGLWKGGFGSASGQAKINGDANGDGFVNGADFLVWQQQEAPGSPISAIPEPSAAFLAFFAAPLAAMIRRKRHGR